MGKGNSTGGWNDSSGVYGKIISELGKMKRREKGRERRAGDLTLNRILP